MTADDAIALLHKLLNPTGKTPLNDTQIQVFRQIWLGETYVMIAQATGYSPDYIKQVSSKLWQLLSKALNQSVSKRNLQTVFQQAAQQDCRSSEPQPDLQRILHNLPAANYSALIGRETETDRLLRFLSYEHPDHCISIEGLGGIGKTTLALSIAYRMLRSRAFEAIVFTSAKSSRLTAAGVLPRLQPDRTLRDIFRAIAQTLDCVDILLQPFDRQLAQIQVQLSRQRTLLVIDNLETIEDWQSIQAFLYDLPVTVKVLLTSRQHTLFPALVLAPLPEVESVDLIQNQSHGKDLDLSAAVIHQLYRQTCGIPAAIVYAVGLVASGYPIASCAVATGDYAHFYFDTVMPLRNSAVHNLFLAFAWFPDAAAPEAIAHVGGVTAARAIAQGLAHLQQLSFIGQQAGRYDMLPLTRDYAIAELEADPAFKVKAADRWVEWYLNFAEAHGGKDRTDWQDYSPLEQEWQNLQAVIEWCISGDRYAEVCQFWQRVRCYSHAQGYRRNRLTCWATRLDWTDWLIRAAEQRQDWLTAADVLFDRAWTLTLLGQPHHLEAAESLFSRAWSYRDRTDLLFQIDLAIHIAVWQIQRQQFSDASLWLQDVEILLNAASGTDATAHQRLWIRWHYYQGEIAYKTAEYPQAQAYFHQALHQAEAINWRRVIFLAKDWLADLALKQGEFLEARSLMEAGLQMAQAQNDRCRTAFCMRSLARLEQTQGNRSLAWRWAEDSRQLFEQLGMQVEAGETIELLQKVS